MVIFISNGEIRLKEKTFKIQVQKNGQVFITIPRDIARLKGLKKGQEMVWKEDGKGRLVLEKK